MGGKILLVEDNSLARRGFAKLLRIEGYSVQDVESGSSALELIESSNFDAVITDFHIGSDSDIDGFDILTHFNQFFPGKGKILMSGTVTDLKRRCDAVGALYFRKPLTIAELLISLQELLAKQTVNSELSWLAGIADSGFKWRADVRQRSRELRRLVEANRVRYNELREASAKLRERSQELARNKSYSA